MDHASPLQQALLKETPQLPALLNNLKYLVPKHEETALCAGDEDQLRALFSLTFGQSLVTFESGENTPAARPLRVGVVFSGGQAPGGHNVVTGIYDALKSLHPLSRLIGFLGGPSGILTNQSKELDEEALSPFRNQGGFDLLGSGRTKIEKEEQFAQALRTVNALELDGLVIIGGDDSNTNAAVLSEYFKRQGRKTQVIGVPKTIDGDLRHSHVEVSFGFDTACKIYSEMIGNIARDCLSAQKYTHFIKLMGRSASHITLECAFQTQPNMALIGEEIAARGQTLRDITVSIADVLCARAREGKNYGVILIPEGLIEFIPEIGALIVELNTLIGSDDKNPAAHLSPESKKCFNLLPPPLQQQLLLERDPHGNVQVAQIATEQLLIAAVAEDLKRRKDAGEYKGNFQPQAHYLGYEGRCGFPSWFDLNYCYALGAGAALLLHHGMTGYMVGVQQLTRDVDMWQIAGIPLTSMMSMERRMGRDRPVIHKALVDLNGWAFERFVSLRPRWALEDGYRYPGPIQFFGSRQLTHTFPMTLKK